MICGIFGCATSKKNQATTVEESLDFVVEVEEGREVRVLQISDTEIIDATQARSAERLNTTQRVMWDPANMEMKCFNYIQEAIDRVKPDFIIFTGDLVYGEFDDAGTSLEALIEYMDSCKIPWAPVLGDKDAMGSTAETQSKALEKGEYCLFKTGDTDGYGNYSVGIRQGKDFTRIFYMMHSHPNNGLDDMNKANFTEGQVKWLHDQMKVIDKLTNGAVIKKSVCFHTPTKEFELANEKYMRKGYEFTINETVKGESGDSGAFQETTSVWSGNNITNAFEAPGYGELSFLDVLKKYHVDSVFAGHCLGCNTSVSYAGIRWTLGLYTTDYEWPLKPGAVSITFGDNVTVKYEYFDEEYQEYIENLDFF